MADATNAPTLLTLTRRPDGAIGFTWQNHATTSGVYTAIQVLMRRKGVTGTWSQVNQLGYPAISNQSYVQYFAPGGGLFSVSTAYEMTLRAFGPLGWSSYSNVLDVDAMETPTPTFTSATRIDADTVRIVLEQVSNAPATTTATYVYGRPVGSGVWKQLNRTVDGSQTTIDVNGLDGLLGYEWQLMATGPAGYSERTSTKTTDAWWQLPPAVSGLLGSRAAGGASTLTWSGDGTARGPWQKIRIYRASGALGQPQLAATLPGTARTWTDSTATPQTPYRYQVVAVSPAGESSSKPEVSLAATLLVPNSPTGGSLTYTATNQATASWTRNATVDRPYTSQQVWWRTVGATAWTVITVSGTATSHTWSVGANRVIEAVVVAVNAAGQSDPGTILGPIATTPTPLPSLGAGWAGSSSILVTIPAVSTIGDGIDIEFSTDGTTWYPAATVTTATRSWLHEDVTTTVPHTYRARVTRSAPAGAPASAWTVSATVPALTTPAAPTIRQPDVVDATAVIPVAVIHQPLDGSAMTAGELRHRAAGTSTWTTISLALDGTAAIPANTYSNGTSIELQARTAGATGVFSPWSATLTVVLRARPTVTITAPAAAAVITAQQTTVTWTPSAQSSAVVELWAGGNLIAVQQHGAAARAATFTGLEDATSYTVTVTVRDQWQPSNIMSRTFTVDIASPPAPLLTATWQPTTGTVALAVTPDAGTPATVRVEVWRSLDGQTWESLGDTDTGWTAVDLLPPLTRPWYKARAYSAEGGWTDSTPVQVLIDSDDVHINWGAGHTRLLRGSWDPSIQVEGGRAKALQRNVGDDAPSITWGRRLPKVIRSSFTVDELLGDQPVTAWEEASEYPGTVIWRDPAGRVLEGFLDAVALDEGDVTQQRVAFTFGESRPS